MGTPNQLWQSIVLAWEHAPSSDRIIEDVERLPRVLEKIVGVLGCVVPDENFRHVAAQSVLMGGVTARTSA